MEQNICAAKAAVYPNPFVILRRRKISCAQSQAALPQIIPFADQMWTAMWDDVDLRIFWRDRF